MFAWFTSSVISAYTAVAANVSGIGYWLYDSATGVGSYINQIKF